MAMLLVIVVGIVFLFGLVQWARSGAVLLDIYALMKGKRNSSSGALKEDEHSEKAHKENVQKSIQNMEVTMDGLLRSSYRLICAVAICVWLVVAVTFVMDLFGFNWVDRLSSTSSHRVTGSPAIRSGSGAGRSTGTSAPVRGDARSDRLREMGAGFRGR